jgi:transposase
MLPRHALTDSGWGRVKGLLPTGGPAADITQADALLDGAGPEAVIADNGYGKKAPVERIEGLGAEAVIPTQKDRTGQREVDRVATRYDKTARNYLAFPHVASVVILLR